MSNTLNLKVVGSHKMHCAGCERSVTFGLARFPGVSKVSADWTKQTIQIELGSEDVDPEKIKAELDWLGYEVAVE